MINKIGKKSMTKTGDWLSEFFSNFDSQEFLDILNDYKSQAIMSGEDSDPRIRDILISLPDSNKKIFSKANKKNQTPSDNFEFQSLDILQEIKKLCKKSNKKQTKNFDNMDKEIIILTEILSIGKIFSERRCKALAIRLVTCFGSLDSALKGMENSKKLQSYAGLTAQYAHFCRILRRYATAVALYHMAVTSTASAGIFEASTVEPPVITSLVAKTILGASDRGSDICKNDLDSAENDCLVTDREILIGVWWVYWSMTRLRDSLGSSSEISFLREVLTKRTVESRTWLRSLRQRCSEGYVPESIESVTLPKSPKKTQEALAISVGDKVAVTALWVRCRYDLERIDKLYSDYSYKFPSSKKLDLAASLDEIPRAFLYKYLDNYLLYTEEIEINVRNRRFVFQTDIKSFVNNIHPSTLLDSMRFFNFEPSASCLIYKFHNSWKCQHSNIGVPFGNSLTTFAMKVVICRIHAEMESIGYHRQVFSYVDDFVISGDTLEDAQEVLIAFDNVLEMLNLQRNHRKTQLRVPGGIRQNVSVEEAVASAFTKANLLENSDKNCNEPTNVLNAPESLTLGGEYEPAIESATGIASIPPCVLKILFSKHVKPYLDRQKAPEKGIAHYTLYRMIKCRMPEAKDAILDLYRICPQDQRKILGWIAGTGNLHLEILKGLVPYYRNLDNNTPWSEYSRTIFVDSLCRACESGAVGYDKELYSIATMWWFSPEIGTMTRRELAYFFKINRISFATSRGEQLPDSRTVTMEF